jgi:hypothetical protein
MSNEVEVPELGFTGLVRFAWRQLTSMRTAAKTQWRCGNTLLMIRS